MMTQSLPMATSVYLSLKSSAQLPIKGLGLVWGAGHPHTMLASHWLRFMEGLRARPPHFVAGTHPTVPTLQMKIFNTESRALLPVG